MAWTGAEYLAWFERFHSSDEARRRVRSVAEKHQISGMVDDLHQAWYLSIRGTTDRLDTSGGTMPRWLADDDDAIRYAVRALRNDATDLTRVRQRAASRMSWFDQREGADAVNVDFADVRPGPEFEASAAVAIDAIRAEIVRMFREGSLGNAQCRNDRVASLALAVIERLTDMTDTDHQPPSVTGGTTEWDKIAYEALAAIEPERFVPSNGRMSPAARQMKVRCGGRVREVLQELFAVHFPDAGSPTDSGQPTGKGIS